MRELFVVNHESTETSLVLRTEDGEEFFLDLAALEGSVRAILGFDATVPSEDAANASAVGTPTPTEDTKPTSDADASAFTGLSAVDSSTPATTDAAPNATDAADGAGAAPGLSVAGASATATGPAQSAHRPLSDRLTMRPPEIQNRIRAGASVADLAMEMNVPESRVEPFAHPILLERARIAELAKQAHPVREDGPAKLTIFEILATAFAARGHALTDATWDAYRVKGEPWTVRVSWKAGLSENEAEWTLKQSMGSPDTLVARNTVAADLTDPDFVQPVRSLTSLGRGRGSRRIEAIDSRDDRDVERDAFEEYEEYVLGGAPADDRDLGAGTDERAGVSALDELSNARQRRGRRPAAQADDAGRAATSAGADTADENAAESTTEVTRDDIPAVGQDSTEDFLQNPDPEPKPTKRRRKAVTPHWEDVLLGVRANTMRPRE
ncbi:septation protein SepH [uncultured Corynebacterium sp.]|uniref:septation protein SepH n=1 Tax=uncultured Corynebacterium sp. TaxID=159447 RepID=UPI0025D52300|nr:septation protein SepH [uncultured Corynebacterium sp.]